MPQGAQATGVRFESGARNPSRPDTGEVVRHLVHELRQPLSTIEAVAYYLQMVLPRQDTKTHHQLAKLRQMVEQVNWILSDAVHVVDVAPPAAELVDWFELVAEAAAERSVERGSIQTALPAESALVRVDPGQVRHLLRGLLGLFCQIARGAGNVVVRGRVDGRETLAEITARGSAYSEEDLERMIDPLNPQLPGGSTPAMLSARPIVSANGGRLAVHSGPGGAVSMLVAFPLAT